MDKMYIFILLLKKERKIQHYDIYIYDVYMCYFFFKSFEKIT